MRVVIALLATAATLCAGPRHARADDLNADRDADLGPAATTGQSAYDGFDSRTRSLHLSMGCGNEFDFMQGFTLASRFGKSDDNPTTQNLNEGLRAWPVTLMIGKAALLNDSTFETPPPEADTDTPRCTSSLGHALGTPTSFGVASTWAPLTKDGRQHADENAADVVNRVYRDWFNTADGSQSSACDGVAEMRDGPVEGGAPSLIVLLRLTPSCIARQIRVVMSDPGHGPWLNKYNEEKGHYEVVPELAGTDPADLVCLSELDFNGIEGVAGDWDMSVTDYTRLAHLLHGVDKIQAGLDRDVAAALDALNRRFLTLRSSPGDATAREGFNLATSCGNTENKFGSAADTMTGAGTDPGIGRYAADGKDAVDGSSFWEDLLRFLAILAIVAAAVVAAAIAGAVLGTLLGFGVVGVGAAIAATAVAVAVIASLFFASILETENHLLMQNSARYLKNKLMMAELSQQGRREQFDELADLNEDVRTWLLDDMQRIAQDDFLEYNSKPYGRLSHFALLNLIDFGCDVQWEYALSAQMQQADAACDPKDRAIVDAAASVLDLSAAKAAVGSLDGRRMIPFRRKSVTNKAFYDSANPDSAAGRPITELVAGADTMVAALQVWTGQMRFAPSGRATPATFGQLIFYSSSRYRPDPMILDIAVDKTTPRWQQYRHDVREAYSSGNGWLITAGGTDVGPANGLDYPGFTLHFGGQYDQRGAGVPTTLMTDAVADAQNPLRYTRVSDYLRFEGNVINWDDEHVSYSDNSCLAGAFACGLNPRTPTGYDKGTCETAISDRFVAIDSTRCAAIGASADPAGGIYIAFYDHDRQWGFFEVSPRARFNSIDDFIAKVRERNIDHLASWGGMDAGDEVTYVTIDGDKLEFTPGNEDFGADRRACGIVNHESGSRFTISSVPAPESGSCKSVGRRLFIDLNDAEHPIREAQGGAPLAPLY